MRKKTTKQKALFAFTVLAGIMVSACSSENSKMPTYEFTTVNRGALVRTISASGTINPVSTVKVLPQMSGKVERIYVDYNDPVRKGDILAELNTDMLRLNREQQNAAVNKARTNYRLQQINHQSQLLLAEKNLISEHELATSRATLDNLASDLAAAEANLQVIETEINQYAYITSPIDGIVLDRKINIGDTVINSSSINSSFIFTLAENLREMQIEAMVGELDIVHINNRQTVRFTLESLPERTFTGEVDKVYLVPVVTNNVVSYPVIINVENLDGTLFPGMTCAVDFIVDHGTDVLLVPNAALRFQPANLSEERIADMVSNANLDNLCGEQRQFVMEARAENVSRNANAGFPGPMGGPPLGGVQPAVTNSNSVSQVALRDLWFINNDGKLDVMKVQIGISSGAFTEIRASGDLEGKQIILKEKA
jgi:HlyD family secretion protein